MRRMRLFIVRKHRYINVHNLVLFVEFSMSQIFLTYDDERGRILTFIAQELRRFSIKRFILQNVLNFINVVTRQKFFFWPTG